ncbi:MAG: GNAT family N-acetyltransferase, partial [Thermodesulfobacteriota bacterium]
MKHEILRFSDDFENHIDQIARLKTINWGLDFDVFRSYVKWNYIDRPHSIPPIIYFVRAGDKIVAMAGVYESTWRIKDAPAHFSALCSADVLILEEYRNKGIYGKMTDFVLEDLERMGVQHFFSFNATPLNAMISLSRGWKSVGQIKIMKKQFQTIESRAMSLVKILAGPYTRKLLRKSGIGGLLKRRERNNSQRIDMIRHNPGTQLPPRVTIDDKPKPAEMALLVNSTLPENKITQVRDEMFFRWRYNNPLSKYLFLYWHDDRLKGYLVLQSHIY